MLPFYIFVFIKAKKVLPDSDCYLLGYKFQGTGKPLHTLMVEALTLKDLYNKQICVFRQPTSTRPVIRLIKFNGVYCVVKDFSENRFFFRNIFGRFLIWRESKAYKRLQGVKGVPEFHGSLEGIALVTSRIYGNDLERLTKNSKPDIAFFDRLNELIERCHKKGIAHCDLKRSSNIIMNTSGRPYIVDWAASISTREFSFFPLKIIFKKFLEDDYKAVIKLKMRYYPEYVTLQEKSFYFKKGDLENIIRFIRNKARECLQRVA